MVKKEDDEVAKVKAHNSAKKSEENVDEKAGDDHRNYPKSPEPGKGPSPYPPEGPLPTVSGDPAPPAFPIGSKPEILAPKPKGKGETDMERMEDATPAPKKPDHCPTCRGRGFIGGAVCPDCDGTGLKK